MCGIAGKFILQDGQVSLEHLKVMTGKISHRGPDDEGFYLSQDKKVGLGHRRLSIIDLSGAGHQPMSNEDGSLWLVFNGEIYNFQDLRFELGRKGHQFRSKTDTETILHLYEEYGKECLQYLKGMFAFVLYDQKRELLFGARDRTGIKPLYYIHNRDSFSFSSEIKGFYGSNDFQKTLDLQAIYDFLTLRYIPWPVTPFKNVFKLGPGHYFVVQHGKMDIVRYSDFDFQEGSSQIAEQERFRSLFERVVQKHLISDAPLGVFLSGGVDSAAVLVAMRNLGLKDIRTFSIGYDDQRFSELAQAREVAGLIGTEHFEKKMSPSDFLNTLDDYIYFMDEPVADLASVPLYLIAKEASKHIKVILSGEGADELFAGYSGFNYEYMFFQTLSWLQKDWTGYFRKNPYVMTRIMNDQEKQSLLRLSNLYEPFDFQDTGRIYARLNKRNIPYHPLNNKLSRLMEYWLPDDLLQKADKMTMAHSIELRVPFLYEDLINFAVDLPLKYKVRFGFNEFCKKVIVKNFLKPYLPKRIISRKKRGFSHPIYQWYLEDKKIFNYINKEILTSSFLKDLFDLKKIQGIIESKTNQKIFNFFVLAKWAKIHL